jgi:hypothetical protein
MVNKFIEIKGGSEMSTYMHRGRLLAATAAVVLTAAPASASAFRLGSAPGKAQSAPQAVRVSPPASASVGFAWDDALIGAGVGAIAVGLGTAGAIGVGRSRRPTDRGVLLG